MPTSRAGSCNSGPAGFTLAEILVVLLIVGALAVLVLPGLGPVLGGDDFRTCAGRLAEVFARARLDAVIDGSRRRVVLDLDTGRFWVDRMPRITAGSGDPATVDTWVADPSLPEPAKRELPPGFRVASAAVAGADPVTEGRVQVRVLPLGLSEPCQLVVADSGDNERRLDVPATGEPVWTGEGGESDIGRLAP